MFNSIEELMEEFTKNAVKYNSFLCKKYGLESVYANLWTIPRFGLVDVSGEKFSYTIHGHACRIINHLRWNIDFDFGPGGRVDGLDPERLFAFSESIGAKFDLKSIEKKMISLETNGFLVRPKWFPNRALYYRSEAVFKT